MKWRVSLLLFFSTYCSIVYGQKVKYKDLVLLLNAKQYETAEVHLKKYLKTTDDNPHAYLFMGIIFQEKSLGNDLLKQTPVFMANADSALLFFDKASIGITEREVKKHDEYYEEMYNRRDPRTGEFGVKFSDVRLDLETRIKNIKERKSNANNLKKYFDDFERLYKSCHDQFIPIQEKFPSQNIFFLKSDDVLIQQLKKLTITYDSATTAFAEYRTSLKSIQKANYNQQLNPQEIVDFKKDGSTLADFYGDDLRLWDYTKWASKSLDAIENEINPLRDKLIAFDNALNKLEIKIKKDSVSVLIDLGRLGEEQLYTQLKKYDAAPLPFDIFEMKKADLKYKSSVVMHKPTSDTVDLPEKLTFLADEVMFANLLDSLSGKLLARDLAAEGENYQHFISKAYGNLSVLNSLIKATNEFATREKLTKKRTLENTLRATKWVVNGTDSIPLVVDQTRELPFKPLLVVENKYTVGLKYTDAAVSGYFYTITPSRRPDVKATFDVDKTNFTKKNLPVLKSLATTDALQLVYFSVIYSESKVQEKYPVTVAKVYRSDGLAWSVNLRLDFMPSELIYNADKSELWIKSSANGEGKIISIDKNGRQVK